MKEIAELGQEEHHLNWLKSMGLWETCFYFEMYYIDEGRIGNDCMSYDYYWGSLNIDDDLRTWDGMNEWQEATNRIRRLNKRHSFRKRYAII